MEIIDGLNIMPSTKINYRTKYKKCLELNIDFKSSENKIIDKLDYLNDKNNNILSYLNICIVLRKHLGLPFQDLKEYRTDLTKSTQDEPTDTNKKNIEKGLPTVNELIEYTTNLFEEKQYTKYIINYLLLATSCRNIDLNCEIIHNDSENNGKDNYLLMRKDKVIFIRNDYKTSKTYKTLSSIIVDPDFIYACNQIPTKYLIPDQNGNKLSNSSISNRIVQNTYNSIGQGRYFKAIINESNTRDIINLSKLRGSKPETILNYYDINKTF